MERKRMIGVLALIIISVFLASFGQIYMKIGLKNTGGLKIEEVVSVRFFHIVFDRYVLLGICLYIVSATLWLVVLSQAEISFAYPLIAIAYIITAFLAKIYFNEHIGILRWLGILLILAGVFFITRS